MGSARPCLDVELGQNIFALCRERADQRRSSQRHIRPPATTSSLEFFGGKRTGDLISRVGSDTDRICSFLSLNLLDFITDVVVIGMTAVMLWINRPSHGHVRIASIPAHRLAHAKSASSICGTAFVRAQAPLGLRWSTCWPTRSLAFGS